MVNEIKIGLSAIGSTPEHPNENVSYLNVHSTPSITDFLLSYPLK